MKNKFPFPVGVEMTGIRRGYSAENEANEVNEFLTEAASTLISVKMTKLYPKRFRIARYRDVHCIEFPSPVFRTLGGMKTFYDALMAQFAHYDIAPHHPDIICGGNHLHFELDGVEWMQKILRDSVNRPWIPWVFTQPDDTESANNFDDEDLGVRLRKARRYLKRKEANPLEHLYTQPYNLGYYDILSGTKLREEAYDGNWRNAAASKEYAFSFDVMPSTLRRGTNAVVLEIRCVEAPLDWSEMKDQLDFFIRYVNYVKTRPMPKGRVRLWKKSDLQKIRRSDCIKEFYALLHELGLDPKRYEKYVRRNLYPRWQLKRQRM
jgi:hypothetical protein